MKKINFPNFTIEDVYALSLSFIDQSRKDRKKIFDQLQDLSPDIYGYGAAYESYAENNNLHLLDSNNFFHVADDLVDLYKNYFRNKKDTYSEIRKYYDLILTNGDIDNKKIIKCPYCLSTVCKHIDHYLPESIYHGLSINPKNLVPSCHNCNTSKKSKIFKEYNGEYVHFFHPYYDDFSDIGWLKANFRMQENILEVEFDVNDDLDIPKSLLDRIQYTFNELEMASYLSDKASETETTNIMSKFRSDQYWMDYTNDEITEVLISDSELFYKSHGKNHWLTVLYKELSLRSDLYGVLKLF